MRLLRHPATRAPPPPKIDRLGRNGLGLECDFEAEALEAFD